MSLKKHIKYWISFILKFRTPKNDVLSFYRKDQLEY